MRDGDRLIGEQLASFRIDRVLGRGGMATVYYGWDLKLERPVAIKVIDARYRDDPAYAVRFVNEARSIAGWHHPNIIQVYAADDEQGLYYFVMEYVPGQDLGALLDATRRAGKLLPVAEVMRLGRAVANGLDYAHERGVIHRDVKPSNVLVGEDGRVLVTDFGLAMNVAQGTLGTVFGSPQYMAPEQARNSADVVPQTDLYSLGVMLYEMLAGHLPFDDPEPLTLARQHMEQEPPPPRRFNPQLSGAVEAVLLKALRKAPADRYQTGQELMAALGQALDVPEPTLPYLDLLDRHQRASAGGALNRASAGAVAAGAVAAMAGAGAVAARGAQAGQAALAGAGAAAARAAVAGRAAQQGARAAGGWLQRHVLAPIGAGLAALWAAARRRPAIGAVIDTLEKHPPARLAAVAVLALLVLEAVWFSGGAFNFGRTVEAGVFGGDGTPTTAAVAAVAATPTVSARAATGATATHAPAQPSAIAAATAAADPATATPTAGPSATPPATLMPNQGDHFTLYYDDTGFYIKNGSDKDRPVSPMAFERLDAAGNVLNRWDGSRWAQFYGDFRGGACMVIQIIDFKDHHVPPPCKNHELVVRTPSLGDAGIFWTAQKGSTQFRVLWNNVEVGRCPIPVKKQCDVVLPPVS